MTIHLALMMLVLGLAQAAPTGPSTGTVTVRLTGFTHSDGSARISLTDSAGFLGAGRALRVASVAVRDGQATVVFEDVPRGRYAVQTYHDENNNRRLDRNFLGIPSEPYGFSNNVRFATRAPAYEEAAFTLAGAAMTLDIRIR
jgi:uncharacterized protein (DUF2141 family)